VLISEAKQNGDSDMVAILSALSWTSKHLSRSPIKSLRRRLRHRDLCVAQLSSAPHWIRGLVTALCSLRSDVERGSACTSLLVCQVDAELRMRSSLEEVPVELVPESLKEAWIATPRGNRPIVAEAWRANSPSRASLLDTVLSTISSAHRPLALTALTVEMESSFRAASSSFTEGIVGHAWNNESEQGRADALSFLFDVNVLDDELLQECGGFGLKTCLLGYANVDDGALVSSPTASAFDETPIRSAPPPMPARPSSYVILVSPAESSSFEESPILKQVSSDKTVSSSPSQQTQTAVEMIAEPAVKESEPPSSLAVAAPIPAADISFEPSQQDLDNSERLARLQANLEHLTKLARSPFPPADFTRQHDDPMLEQIQALQNRIMAVFDAVAL